MWPKIWIITIIFWIVISLVLFGIGNSYLPYIPDQCQKLVDNNSQRFGLDKKIAQAIILTESSGSRSALSQKGAVGLMQLMPTTAQSLAKQLKLPPNPDLTNPEINLILGCYYLRQLYRRFDGDIVLVLSAYNTGPSRVASWCYHDPQCSSIQLLEKHGSRETKNFVLRVLERYRQLLDQDK